MKIVYGMVILAVVCSGVGRAAAQACSDGRERTGGHCCWPGQTWSRSDRVCEGAPTCPDGLVESGEECVVPLTAPGPAPSAAPPQAAPPIVAPRAAAAPGVWPSLPDTRPAGVINPVHVSGLDVGLAIAGGVTLGVGYLMQVIFAGLEQPSNSCRGPSSGVGFSRDFGCDSWPLGLIPFAGGIASSLVSFNGSRYTSAWVGFQVPAVTIELVGLGLLIHAVLNPTDDVVELPEGGRLSVRFDAPNADVGLSLRVEL